MATVLKDQNGKVFKTINTKTLRERVKTRDYVKKGEVTNAQGSIKQSQYFGSTLNFHIGGQILNLGVDGKGTSFDSPSGLYNLWQGTGVKMWTNNNPLVVQLCNILSRKILSAENNIGFIVNFKITKKIDSQQAVKEEESEAQSERGKTIDKIENKNSILTEKSTELNKLFEEKCLQIGQYDRRRVSVKALLQKVINSACLDGISFMHWNHEAKTYQILTKENIDSTNNNSSTESPIILLLKDLGINNYFYIDAIKEEVSETKAQALHEIAKSDPNKIENENEQLYYKVVLQFLKVGLLEFDCKGNIVFTQCFLHNGRVISAKTGLEIGCIVKSEIGARKKFIAKDMFFSFSLNTSQREFEQVPVFLYALANIAVYTMLEEAMSARANISSRIYAIISPKDTNIPYLGHETETSIARSAMQTGEILEDLAKDYNQKTLAIISFPHAIDTAQLNSMSNDDFASYMQKLLARIGAMFGITYSEFTGDGSEVNYNSAMSSQDEAYKTIRQFQDSVKCTFKEVIDHILDYVIKNEIKDPNHRLYGLFSEYDVSYEIEFKNDITAEIFKQIKQVRENVLNGLISHQEGLTQLGLDASKEKTQIQQEAKDKAILDAKISSMQIEYETELLSKMPEDRRKIYLELRGSNKNTIKKTSSANSNSVNSNEFQGGETARVLEDNEGSYGENS